VLKRAVLSLLVVATAVASTVVTHRSEEATTDRARDKALSQLAATLQPTASGDVLIGVQPTVAGDGFTLPVYNSSSIPFVLHSLAVTGERPVVVDALVPNQESVPVTLPLPTCPTHRLTTGLDKVDAVVMTHGGRRTLTLDVPNSEEARALVNSSCGLLAVRESYGASIKVIRKRAGAVVLTVGLQFSGKRDTDLLSVRAASGVTATVTQHLPMTVAPTRTGDETVIRDIPDLLTVSLTITDCAAVEAYARDYTTNDRNDQDPRFDQVQLLVRRPGEEVEKINLSMQPADANAFGKACRLDPIPEIVYG
jgi:hypothetical protein